MRIALIAALITAPGLLAQRPNVTSPTGFGRILFPGGTPANTTASPFGRIIYPGTGAPAVTRNVRATPAPPANHPGHSGSSLIPYPVYLGGNYLQYDPPQAPLASNYSQTPGQPDVAPVVIVNQYFRPDAPPPVQQVAAPIVERVEREVPAVVDNSDKDLIYLIAMKDHTIYAAKSYWVEDGTLNYTTIQGVANSVSMDLVDRDLSRRLNRSQQVAFGLPGN